MRSFFRNFFWTRISPKDAIAAAKEACERTGRPWLEPVTCDKTLTCYRIRTNLYYRDSCLAIFVGKEDGFVTKIVSMSWHRELRRPTVRFSRATHKKDGQDGSGPTGDPD